VGRRAGPPCHRLNGFFVVEADTPQGHNVDGLSALSSLEQQHGKLPATLMAISPTGSLHHYFNHPGDVKIVSRALVSGVDCKGDGGMVIAPPSVRVDVGSYVWANDLPIADAPPWLLELVTLDDTFKERGTADELTADGTLVNAAVEVIPNDNVDWDDWNKIGLAIFAATSGNDAGFATFDAWSRKSNKYNAKDTENKWHAFHTSPPDRIGAGTLLYLAEQASPGWRDTYDEELEARINAAAHDEVVHAAIMREFGILLEDEQAESQDDEKPKDDEKQQPAALTIDEWIARDLPKPDFICGKWITTTSRVDILRTDRHRQDAIHSRAGDEIICWDAIPSLEGDASCACSVRRRRDGQTRDEGPHCRRGTTHQGTAERDARPQLGRCR
jgi:hypothetical protein